jgi:predicted nucleic acid-binding protein
MRHYFFDSSGLVKRYIAEVGSAWVQSLCAPDANNTLYLSRITGAEVIAAIFRRQRMGDLLAEDAQAVSRRFREDFRQAYRVIEVTAEIVERAMDLAETRALRGYDAVQLATALHLHRIRRELDLPPLVFVSADEDLNAVAEAEGLHAENPNVQL